MVLVNLEEQVVEEMVVPVDDKVEELEVEVAVVVEVLVLKVQHHHQEALTQLQIVWKEVAVLEASQVQETHLALGQTLDMVHLLQAMKSEEGTPGISKKLYLRKLNMILLMDE